MAQHLEGLMSTSMEKIRELVDVDTIIGKPISSPDGSTIIPISKVSFGFVSGGSDIPAKVDKDVFAGGAGAGITIKPQAFIVINKNGEAKILELGGKASPIEEIIDSAPELLNKLKGMFGKKGSEDEEAGEDAEEDASGKNETE